MLGAFAVRLNCRWALDVIGSTLDATTGPVEVLVIGLSGLSLKALRRRAVGMTERPNMTRLIDRDAATCPPGCERAKTNSKRHSTQGWFSLAIKPTEHFAHTDFY